MDLLSKREYDEYLSYLKYERRMYMMYKAQFIQTMLNYGASPWEVFMIAYDHNLKARFRDVRIKRTRTWVTLEEYPSFLDWFKALREYKMIITIEDFKKAYTELDEYFKGVFTTYEYVLTHFNRYMMQHEAIYGEKKEWKKI